jgi:hypothetical protein
LAAALEP